MTREYLIFEFYEILVINVKCDEDCWEGVTLANLGNDHEFISTEYMYIGMSLSGEAQSKDMRAYAQSGQYHIIVEVCDF